MSTHPNILVITTHDSGQHFGCYGVEEVRTPAIDGLAAEGYRFENCFTAAPQCSPGRASLLTGRYPQSNGVLGLVGFPWSWTLGDDEVHLAERLSEVGYDPVLFNFQHEAVDPSRLGFRSVVPDDGSAAQSADVVAESVASFLDERSDADPPFYAQVGLRESHHPLDSDGTMPDTERGVYIPPQIVDNDAARREFAQLQGSIRRIDEAVERIRSALSTTGLKSETLVVFTSDHGIDYPREKGYLYDGGLAVPLIMYWPNGGVDGGVTLDWPLSNVDVLPTLLDLIDVPVPDSVEGQSFTSAFEDANAEAPREAVFAQFTDHNMWGFGPHARCVRTERYKLIRNFSPDMLFDIPIDLSKLDGYGRVDERLKSGPRPVVELYDLQADPNEFENVADDPGYADVRTTLECELRTWMERVDDPLFDGPVESPYYDEAIADFREGSR